MVRLRQLRAEAFDPLSKRTLEQEDYRTGVHVPLPWVAEIVMIID